MGFTTPFTTFVSSAGALIAGFIRDATGSYISAFQILVVLLVLSFFFIFFTKPPAHPSLKQSRAQSIG
jgi:MFS-type transporter involved in bile tolerance (Atg22 family)